MKFRWSLPAPPSAPSLEKAIATEFHLPDWVARCLVGRGWTDLAELAGFLEPKLKNLSDPFLVPDMRKAVDRLFEARLKQEKVLLFGDYDVDGVASTALLHEVLSGLGWSVSYYLPHRLKEGYGLSQEAVEEAVARTPARVLVAVDCGSTAAGAIQWLNERGVDVLVLDHHQISTPAPAAMALVNPHAGFGEPGTGANLCSAGLAFKLAHALVKHGREAALEGFAEVDLRHYLDLTALGTVADLVPLTGENRILAAAGLKRLEQTARPGLIELKKVSQTGDRIGVYEVGFQLAPRLNAAGRLETAMDALNLILARDEQAARPIAQALDTQNRNRQRIEKNMTEQVLGELRSRFNPETDWVLVEGQLLWHVGVVGIVAARVLREFHRPTIIVGGEGEEWRGSGRSIEGFDLAAALRHCDDLLLRHGGHAMAAGLSVRPENLPALRERLNDWARQTLSPEALTPRLRLDAEVSLSDLSLEALEAAGRLQPFGQGNPPVQVLVSGLRHQRPPRRMGKSDQHLKMWVTDGNVTHETVWWNCPEPFEAPDEFALAAVPEINEFNGRRSVQLRMLDWRPL